MGMFTTREKLTDYQCDECGAKSRHFNFENRRSSRLRCTQCGSAMLTALPAKNSFGAATGARKHDAVAGGSPPARSERERREGDQALR